MRTYAVECQGLTKHYGPVTALDGLDLQVPQSSLLVPRTQRRREDDPDAALLGLATPTGTRPKPRYAAGFFPFERDGDIDDRITDVLDWSG